MNNYLFNYDAFTGNLSLQGAFIQLVQIAIGAVIPDVGAYRAAYDVFVNFVNNIGTALSNPSVGDILRLIPDFAVMIVGLIPGSTVAGLISSAYDIAVLL